MTWTLRTEGQVGGNGKEQLIEEAAKAPGQAEYGGLQGGTAEVGRDLAAQWGSSAP